MAFDPWPSRMRVVTLFFSIVWQFLVQLFSPIGKLWQPEANLHLRLDHVVRDRAAEAAHDAPFRAFIASSKRHMSFIGAGFSPGASGKYLCAGA